MRYCYEVFASQAVRNSLISTDSLKLRQRGKHHNKESTRGRRLPTDDVTPELVLPHNLNSSLAVPLSYNSLLCGVALSCPNPFRRDLQQKIARLVPTATQKLPIQENFFQVQVNANCRLSAPLFALINAIRATVEEYSTNTIYRALHLNRNSAKTIQIKKLRRKQRQRG
jgi:hypothetical protein